MSKLTMAQRTSLPKSDFANPSAAPGHGSFPIENASHVRSALSYIRYANPQTAAKIRTKAKAMGIGMKAPKKIQGK